MRRGLLLWVLALLIVCLGSAHAFQLAYQDAAGTVRWYLNQMVITGAFTTQPMTQTIRMSGTVKFTCCEKVLEVSDDGTATIQSEIMDGSVSMTFPGAEQPPMNMPMTGFKVNYKRSPTGKVTDMTIEGQPDGMMGMQGMNMADQWKMFSNTGAGFEFPAGEIQAGHKWTNEASIEMMPGQKMEMKMVNMLQGPQVVDKVSYLQINSDLTMNMPAMKIQVPVGDGQTMTLEQVMDMGAKSYTLFDAAAGEINRTWMSGTLNMKITMPMPGANETITTTGKLNISGGMNKTAPPVKTNPPANANPPAPDAK